MKAPTSCPAPMQFASNVHDSIPMLRRSSDTEVVLSVGVQNMTLADDVLACEAAQEETTRQELRQAEALCQRGYARRNAMIILMDDDKFHQIQHAIKQTGVLTGNGVKQVLLAPTVGDPSHTTRFI